MPRMRHALLAVALPAALLVAAPAPLRVAADEPTVSSGPLRTDWDGAEPAITPAALTNGSFQQQWAKPLEPAGFPTPAVAYAQPVTSGGIVVVATEHDVVDGFDEVSGGLLWQRVLGTFEPDSRSCGQVTPHLGITSTPVVDPVSRTVYVMARDYHGASNTRWQLHALDMGSGAERAGWPVTIGGTAYNRPGLSFDAYQHQQRPALLLLDGTVFAGFGSFCDIGPYYGWIASVSTSNPAARSLYTDEPTGADGAFWASGGGFVADSPTSFLATSANPPANGGADGSQAPAGPGSQASSSRNLADAVVRFSIGGDHVTVTPTDYFSPIATDSSDSDLGSSQVSALPDGYFNVPGHPHLAMVGGKSRTLYLLDRDHLGGRTSNDSGALGHIDTDQLFGHVASWPGDGGHVYMTGDSHLLAFHIGSDGSISQEASVPVCYGGGSPHVTSNGTAGGSAVAWMYERGSGELRGYAAAPRSGVLTLLFHEQVGQGGGCGGGGPGKFTQVASDAGHILIAADDGLIHVLGVGPNPHDPRARQGYWEVASDGGIFPWGNAAGLGSTGGMRLNQPIVGMAGTAHGRGYYLVARDGGLFPFGDAARASYGSLGGTHLNQPIVGMAANPRGGGYWMVASDGGVFPFGRSACGCGSLGDVHLNAPIIGMAATATGNGYWLVAADGGIFPFGDATSHSYGSTGGMHLNRPIVGMAATRSGNGYFLVASDGGIFPFGDARAHSHGSAGGMHLNQPVVGMAVTAQGDGYCLAAADGGIFTFGDAVGYGSTGNMPLNAPMVGVAST